MIKCKNLTKIFKDKTAVDSLSFNINSGEVFGILGANGAGKTTTIRMILNLTKATSGDINIKEGIKIGFSPETPYFPPFLSTEEIMKFYGKIQGLGKAQIEADIVSILQKVGMYEERDTKVKNCSKGMLQRLAVAQALLGNPEMVILDEPTAGLDALGRIEMINLIKELKKEGKTVLLNSHILNDVEKVVDRVLIMKKGKKLKELNFREKRPDKSLEEIFVEVLGGVNNVGNYA